MRFLLILALYTVFPTNAFSAKIYGYIVTLTGDTVKVRFSGINGLVPRNINKSISTQGELGQLMEYTPDLITAFGYSFKGREHIYRSKPIENGKLRFLELVTEGNGVAWYLYFGSANQASGQHCELYTFEKNGKEWLFLDSWQSLEKLSTGLRTFYSSYEEEIKVIPNLFRKRKDIQADLRIVFISLTGRTKTPVE